MHGVIKSGENHHNTTTKKQYLCIKIRRIMANRQEIVCTYIYENYVQSDLDDIDELEAHNEDFRTQENEEQLLAVYFDIPAAGEGRFMTTAEISDKLVSWGSIKKPMPLNRLGMLLKKAGYTQKCLSGKARGWLVRERGLEEVNANRNINARP